MKVIFLSQSENLTDPFLEGLAVSIEIFDYTLIQWIEASIDHMKNKYSDFVVIESLPTTLANLPAHQLVYTGGEIKQSLYVYQTLCVATKKGNSIYFIMYRAQKEKYLKFLTDVEQMISSFQFIE
jgi:eukaryotic-like serine/threonine-protein kinase